MPELPDLTVYIEHLDRRVTGETLQDIRLASPFVLRTVSPTIEEVRDRVVTGLRRLAKQIVFELEGGFFVVIHLMVAGRLQWRGAAKATPKGGRHRSALAAFDFASGTLLLTEASRNKRASLRLVRGEDALAALDPGGLEIVAIDLGGFVRQLRESRHTLKRTLTDQRIFAGIGNAYSDEILLHAGLSPFKRSMRAASVAKNSTDRQADGLQVDGTSAYRTAAGRDSTMLSCASFGKTSPPPRFPT